VRVHPLAAALTALLLSIVLTACGGAAAAPGTSRAPGGAPDRTYAVGIRTLMLDRGHERPLPVTVWYPARSATPPPSATPMPVRNAEMAAGRFPVVLFSHGLHSLPELHTPLTSRWAAAGFVVAAPAYPHTKWRAPRFDRADVRRQPGDARWVLEHLRRLDRRVGDRFAGHLALDRVGAAGHSAGGYTTAGLFTPGHPAWLRAGIVISGGGMAGATYGGPAAPQLFLHGDADRIVPLARGWAAYRQVPWPKAFLRLANQGHGEFLTPGRRGFEQVVAVTTEFLRWTLYADPAALSALRATARSSGIAEFTDQLG